MEDNNSIEKFENKKISNSPLQKISNALYSIFFGLPFTDKDNYEKLKKMSKDEKIKYFIMNNKEQQHKKFIIRLINMRSNILDDEDKYHYEEVKNKTNKISMVIFFLFAANWSVFCYHLMVKKSRKFKLFLVINSGLFCILFGMSAYLNKENDRLFKKYKNILPEEEIFQLMRKTYNMD
jgi:hypothetical protein